MCVVKCVVVYVGCSWYWFRWTDCEERKGRSGNCSACQTLAHFASCCQREVLGRERQRETSERTRAKCERQRGTLTHSRLRSSRREEEFVKLEEERRVQSVFSKDLDWELAPS